MFPCPGSEDLERFLNRQLADAAEETVLAHLDRCAACLETLEELTKSNLASGPKPAPPAGAAEPSANFWQRLMAAPVEVMQARPGHLERIPTPSQLLREADRDDSPSAAPSAHALPSPPAPGSLTYPAGPAELQVLRQAGYEVVGMLGRGGMGVVHKARHTSLKRWVALKVICAEAAADPQYRARFRVEAEAVARLQHPNIVQIYDVGERQGLAYLALEYVDGGTLAQHLAGKPQDPRAAAQLLETLAHAMHFAHQHGIVHRDLKPANILLVNGGVSGEWCGTNASPTT